MDIVPILMIQPSNEKIILKSIIKSFDFLQIKKKLLSYVKWIIFIIGHDFFQRELVWVKNNRCAISIWTMNILLSLWYSFMWLIKHNCKHLPLFFFSCNNFLSLSILLRRLDSHYCASGRKGEDSFSTCARQEISCEA